MSKCMTFQILVMTKAAGLALQAELRVKGRESHFFHSGLEAADKDKIHGVLGKITVIATTGLVVNVYEGDDEEISCDALLQDLLRD
jgi:hypothetical protein